MAFQTIIKKKEVRGTVTIPAGNTSVDVSLTMPTTDYVVLLTPDTDVGVYVTNKSTTGFTINLNSSKSVDVKIDYFVKEI